MWCPKEFQKGKAMSALFTVTAEKIEELGYASVYDLSKSCADCREEARFLSTIGNFTPAQIALLRTRWVRGCKAGYKAIDEMMASEQAAEAANELALSGAYWGDDPSMTWEQNRIEQGEAW